MNNMLQCVMQPGQATGAWVKNQVSRFSIPGSCLHTSGQAPKQGHGTASVIADHGGWLICSIVQCWPVKAVKGTVNAGKGKHR